MSPLETWVLSVVLSLTREEGFATARTRLSCLPNIVNVGETVLAGEEAGSRTARASLPDFLQSQGGWPHRTPTKYIQTLLGFATVQLEALVNGGK